MNTGPPSLLIVDDDENNRDMLGRRLQRRGYGITCASDGKEALQLLETQSFDLILLDIMMPGISGIDVLQAIRSKHSMTELPVVMATAVDASEHVVNALDLGANDYVTKPFDFPVVLARIRSQVEVRRSAQVASQPPTVSVATSLLGPDSLLGASLGGRYQLEHVLGVGGFGVVYQATDGESGVEVAVKVLMGHLKSTARDLKRFQREARAAAQVDHHNAVRVLDISVTDAGSPYYVMELLKGRTLADELKEKQTVPPSRCAEILFPICDLLGMTHARGLIHRDLKPSNVFLQQTDRGEAVKVVDFGIAKIVGHATDGDSQNLTVTDEVLGTPAYMAPERLLNKPYDGCADVYSLGIMLYEMLTGQPPFYSPQGERMAVAMMQIHQEPPPVSEQNPQVPPAVEAAVLRALTKDPVLRPTAIRLAHEFAGAVNLAIDGNLYENLAKAADA